MGFAQDQKVSGAWLSTWSGLSSNASFVRCAPEVTIPTLFIEPTGDQACVLMMLADLRHAAWVAAAARVTGSGNWPLARDRPAKMLCVTTACSETL